MTIPDLTPAEIERFYGKLHLGGCGLIWSGETNRHGYGRFNIYRDGRRVRILAHRLAYKLATGDDPGESVIRHQCDTPPCCTPDCFLLGTQGDNIRDAIDRGRWDGSGLQASRDARDANAFQRLADSHKRCSRCKRVKPFSEFYRASANIDGRMYWCKECCTAHAADRKRGEAA